MLRAEASPHLQCCATSAATAKVSPATCPYGKVDRQKLNMQRVKAMEGSCRGRLDTRYENRDCFHMARSGKIKIETIVKCSA